MLDNIVLVIKLGSGLFDDLREFLFENAKSAINKTLVKHNRGLPRSMWRVHVTDYFDRMTLIFVTRAERFSSRRNSFHLRVDRQLHCPAP